MGVDPGDLPGDGEGDQDMAADFSDHEDEFGGDGSVPDPAYEEKFDCPKAKFAKGDCHQLE